MKSRGTTTTGRYWTPLNRDKTCMLCPRDCGVDRSIRHGACGVEDRLRVASIIVHQGEEPPLVHDAGSGAIFFCGCPLRCSFCQNAQISQSAKGRILSPSELAAYMIRLEVSGCSNINLVTPSHFTPKIIEALCLAHAKGLTIPVVFNSGGYEKVSTLKVWQANADIFLIDLKYGDNRAGRRFSRVDDYWDRAREAIAFVLGFAGPLVTNDKGKAIKGLIVRHLVLPDMLSNPFAVLEFLAVLSTNIPISLMSQYDPRFYHHNIPGLKRRLKENEYQVVIERALDLGFETIFTQAMDASLNYSPDFMNSRPFGDNIDMMAI